MVEIVIPELQEMHTAHLVSIGFEFIHSMITDIEDGKGVRLNYDSRTSVRLFDHSVHYTTLLPSVLGEDR
ncbi:hypothetical protein OIU78_018207 [Salix suchowensis]|nr:hypothetical protein OIU78_018207 [Salix suchowensis]